MAAQTGARDSSAPPRRAPGPRAPLLLALLAAASCGAARAQYGGAAVPADVAVRWSALNPKKWNFTQLQAAMPLLRAPPGFKIELYYKQGLVNNARSLAVSGNSKYPGGPIIVYASTKMAKQLWALIDWDGDGTADKLVKLAQGLDTPQGMDWYKGDLYVSGWEGPTGVIWRLKDIDSYALSGRMYQMPPPDKVTTKLPVDRWHGERYMRFGPDGLLYVSIGAPCDVCEERKAATGLTFSSIYTLDVTQGDAGWRTFATGLRNVVGMDWHPDKPGDLYFTENGRDNMGDNTPDCVLNRAERRGLYYGFPRCHTQGSGDPFLRPLGPGAPIPDPAYNDNLKCDDPRSHRRPLQALGPHIAPLGLRFYKWELGKRWPKSYDRALIIAQHGSMDRSSKIGYRLVTVKLAGATSATPRPSAHEEFVTGWVGGRRGAPRAQQPAFGRPADVVQLPDGSVLISDDQGHTVYRLQYTG